MNLYVLPSVQGVYADPASFRGTPSGKGSHDEVARRIALNGQCWVERSNHHLLVMCNADKTAWRRDDLQAYMFRLYLEYARLISPDRDNGKMVCPPRFLMEHS
jgi:beta-1,2-xylosyltransferase